MNVGRMLPFTIYNPSLQWLFVGWYPLSFTVNHDNDCLWDDTLWDLQSIITITDVGMLSFEIFSISYQWLLVGWYPLIFTVHHYNDCYWDHTLWDLQVIISMTVCGMISFDIYCSSLQWLLVGWYRFAVHHYWYIYGIESPPIIMSHS